MASSHTMQSTTSGPSPLCVYLPLFLGSHAQKLGCFAPALHWLSGWHLPLTVPGFCLPEGSPARGSTTPEEATSQKATWVSLPYLSNVPLRLAQGALCSYPRDPSRATYHHHYVTEHFPSQERGERQKGSWLRGGNQHFCFGEAVRLSFFLSHVHV